MSNKRNIDLSGYVNVIGHTKFRRMIWNICWTLVTKFLPRSVGNGIKVALIRFFGGQIHKTAVIYSSVKIFMPWNLVMEEYTCLGPEVDCYNVGTIRIKAHSTVSQRTYLCTASHNVKTTHLDLVIGQIEIGSQVWIAAESFVGPDVNIGEGVVIGARSVVFKDLDSWSVYAGHPAKKIKERYVD